MDVRAIERMRKRGIMSTKEAEKLLKGLPDVKDKAMALGDINAVTRGDDVLDDVPDDAESAS